MSAGGQSTFTQEKADYICEKISQGITLSEICREDGMPSRVTVYNWAKAKGNEEFALHIARARESGFDEIAEDCLRIADYTAEDTIQTKNGPAPDMEWIQRSKLRVETRLKLLAKWDPKRYGERLDLTTAGEKMNTPPPAINIFTSAPPMASAEDQIDLKRDV